MLVSSVKFLAGPPIVYYGQLDNYTFLEANMYCIAGGSLGVLFFMFLSKKIITFFNIIRIKHQPSQKKFSNRTRKMVVFWKTYGLLGIAFVTPVILSIPVGTFIATKFVSNKKKIFLYMFCSIVLWSIILTTLMEFFKEVPFNNYRIDETL